MECRYQVNSSGEPSRVGSLDDVRTLDGLGLRYFAVGSVASSIHGIARFTNDVDLVVEIDEPAIEEIAAQVEESFYLDVDEAKRSFGRRAAFQSASPRKRGQDRYFPGRDGRV